MYHHAKFHASRCHHRRDICNRTEKKQRPIAFHTNVWRVININSKHNVSRSRDGHSNSELQMSVLNEQVKQLFVVKKLQVYARLHLTLVCIDSVGRTMQIERIMLLLVADCQTRDETVCRFCLHADSCDHAILRESFGYKTWRQYRLHIRRTRYRKAGHVTCSISTSCIYKYTFWVSSQLAPYVELTRNKPTSQNYVSTLIINYTHAICVCNNYILYLAVTKPLEFRLSSLRLRRCGCCVRLMHALYVANTGLIIQRDDKNIKTFGPSLMFELTLLSFFLSFVLSDLG